MTTGGVSFVAGGLMGLASSLHCAGLCGGIASSLLLATTRAGASASERAASLVHIQTGRAFTYTLFGALVGFAGSAFTELLNFAGAQLILRVAAAATLALVGLSVGGVLPSIAALDRAIGIALPFRRFAIPRSLLGTSGFSLGVVWGFAPCGMVYAALLNAMLTGSLASGAMFMAGFGVATIPPVAITAYGVSALARLGISFHDRRLLRRTLGFGILAFGIVSAAEPAIQLSALCLGR